MSFLIVRKYSRITVRGTVALVAFLLMPGTTMPQPVSREYKVKSAFLFNFTQFVEWPADAFEDDDAPLVIGILGSDPFGPFLDETISGERLQEHPLIVERYESIEEVGHCHILFLASGNRQTIRQAIAHLKSKAVLTVSDFDGFARMGGMIAFENQGGRVALRINATTVNESGLVVSSKLLRLAEIVP